MLTLVASRGFAVTNAVVGTCVAGTHYTTIQAAVNAATSPSTVQICPGTYQEQIEIKSALTLMGVTQGTSNSVVILPPAKGLAYNSLSGLFGKLFVNVYVHANAAVTISNITIDGGGGTACPATGYRVGLLYQGGGGSVTNSSFVDSPTCAKSIAAMADVTSGFTFTNNTLADCGGVCFELDYGDTTTVSGNTITHFKNGAIGIDIQQVAGPATVSNNIITGNLFSTGIYSTTSTDLTITGNNIVVPITGNGIKLFNDSLSIVENNHLAGGYGISIDDSTQGSGNTVKSNTIKDAGCGIDIIYLNGTVTTPNTVFTTENSTCTVI